MTKELLQLKNYGGDDWFRKARYNGPYKSICAIGHSMTGGKCTLCDNASTNIHHAQYYSWRQWLSDIYNLLRGKEIKPPLWQPPGKDEPVPQLGGLTQGREQHGWSAFPLCSHCHDGIVHSSRHWKAHRNRERACWHNRNKFWMLWWLRINWHLKRERLGLTQRGWTWLWLLRCAAVGWWLVRRLARSI